MSHSLFLSLQSSNQKYLSDVTQTDPLMLYDDEGSHEYKKIKQLGEGTYGRVYLCKNHLNGEQVVIKQMKKFNVDDNQGFEPTAIREVSILKNLKHPFIVDIKDVFISTPDKYFCVVFEHCKQDLYGYMQQMKHVGGIPLKQIKKFTYQLLSALNHMHSSRILHRDIKPQNILLTHDCNVKIADFGLGKEFNIPIPDLTKEVVTLWYRPPEVLLGIDKYTTKLDIWSLGCVIGEMIRNAEPLFEGFHEWEVILKIFQLLGTPIVDDKWIKNCQYFQNKFPKFVAKDIKCSIKRFKDNKYLVDIFEKMIRIDPQKRINAIRLIEHKWFDKMELKQISHRKTDPIVDWDRCIDLLTGDITPQSKLDIIKKDFDPPSTIKIKCNHDNEGDVDEDFDINNDETMKIEHCNYCNNTSKLSSSNQNCLQNDNKSPYVSFQNISADRKIIEYDSNNSDKTEEFTDEDIDLEYDRTKSLSYLDESPKNNTNNGSMVKSNTVIGKKSNYMKKKSGLTDITQKKCAEIFANLNKMNKNKYNMNNNQNKIKKQKDFARKRSRTQFEIDDSPATKSKNHGNAHKKIKKTSTQIRF